MVINDEDYSNFLVQISTVKSALNNTVRLTLKEHINFCIIQAVENVDKDKIVQLEKAIDKLYSIGNMNG